MVWSVLECGVWSVGGGLGSGGDATSVKRGPRYGRPRGESMPPRR